jgi:hypothetical protein
MNRIYQINIRQHLFENNINRLSQIEAGFWEELSALGFDCVWLMGIWQICEDSIEKSSQIFGLDNSNRVVGSCFAIEDYIFDTKFCTENEVLDLKKQLNNLGLKLILDFIPNHFGSSTAILNTNPDIFLSNATPQEFYFEHNGRWFAHAKDPNFEPWSDTVQLDYSKQQTLDFIYTKLVYICKFCDGLRCDMAMLVIPEVFEKSWNVKVNTNCFWQASLLSIKLLYPDFVFVGEVYWDYNKVLYDFGFDYCYQKEFLDKLEQGNLREAIETAKDIRDIIFLENHDEERSTKVFDIKKLRTYFGLCLELGNPFLIQYGQLSGQVNRIPIQILDIPSYALDGTQTNLKELLLTSES